MKNLIKKIFGIKDGTSIRGVITIRAYKAGTNELVQEIISKNMIMQGANIGKDLIVQKLIATATGSDPYTLHITHGAIGTSQTAVTSADTRLGAEVARVSPAFGQDNSSTIAVLQFFFPDSSLTNQTYYEFGTFVDGAAGANTGQLFNHALFGLPYAKAAGIDTTIEVDITLT